MSICLSKYDLIYPNIIIENIQQILENHEEYLRNAKRVQKKLESDFAVREKFVRNFKFAAEFGKMDLDLPEIPTFQYYFLDFLLVLIIFKTHLKMSCQISKSLKRPSQDSSFNPNAKQIKLSKEESDNIFAIAMSGNSISTGAAMNIDYSKYKISKKTPSPTPSTRSPISDSTPSTSSGSSSVSPTSASSIKFNAPEAPKVDENMVTRRNERQKVFAGRRKQQVLAENSRKINIRDGNINSQISYQELKPELIKLNLEDLRKVLFKNPHLAKDSDELFLNFIKKDFPKQANQENKKDLTWRQLLEKLSIRKKQKENEKLEMLTKRIAKTHQQNDKEQRKTIVIGFSEAKPRRGPTKTVQNPPKAPTMEQKSEPRTSAKPQPKPAPVTTAPIAPISRQAPSKKPAKKHHLWRKLLECSKDNL
ncbi:unnamed protein product [Caenorhabditis angaria]|uniref:Uncharacterized protein n=1 Tax=Caenorhabditis angaria TaxID=860376 RepID=A0A9P1IM28_9PELO|nr:unnamed protein product [Caenorhabditis angaria]